MRAKYLHIGIPITNKKPGMMYLEPFKVWISNTEDYDLSIEYLKYEEGTPFPEVLHKNIHVAYEVEDMQPYFDKAERIIFGPADLSDTMQFAYIEMDNAIIELQAPKK